MRCRHAVQSECGTPAPSEWHMVVGGGILPRMRPSSFVLAMMATLVLSTAMVACGGSDSAPRREQTVPADGGNSKQSRSVTVGCEGITPRPGWRRQTTSVGNFALFVKHLASQATELSNGNVLVKAGAAVVGHQRVTLRVPNALRGTVGLVYGNASRGRGRRPETAPTEMTFRPCQGKPRSGYVGGLLFRGKAREIVLEVLSDRGVERLRLQR